MSGLSAHEWDRYGSPPPLGPRTYAEAGDAIFVNDRTAEAERLLQLADDCDERARDLEDDAEDERNEATGFRDSAEIVIDEIAPIDAQKADDLRKRLDRE